MVTKQELVAFGREIRKRRLEKGCQTLTEFSKRTGISRQYLSGLENGYVKSNSSPSIPTDNTLDSLSKELDIPLPRLHALLGRIPEKPPVHGPEAEELATDFEALPPFAKPIVRAAMKAAKEVVAQVAKERATENVVP